MSKRKIIINEVCKINAETINGKNPPIIIRYLDTSSITNNKIEKTQVLNSNVSKFPSRAQRKVKTHTIIYSTVRPEQEHFGIIENENKDLIVSTGFLTLDVIDCNIDPKYLYYLITRKNITSFLQTVANNNVSAYPAINPSDLGNLFFLIPKYLSDQQKIASVLSSLDSKIEINNRINAKLEAMAKTLYDYWFVQFDFPDKDGKPYKTNGGKMIWNEELKRKIPDAWKVKKMADWIASDKSGDWGKDKAEGNYTERVSCIRGADINGLIGIENCAPPTRYILEKSSQKILNSHDLIIEISGGSPTQSTGRLAYITEATLNRFSNPLICSNFCKAISLKDKAQLFNFAYYWNSLYNNGVFFGYEGKTSGIKNFLFDNFVKSCWTVVPDEMTTKKFYAIMQNIETKKQKALTENQTLSSLRDWLLPMLINGQVRVEVEYGKEEKII